MRATPPRPYLLQLHLDLFGCFCLPVSLWLGVGLPLHPRGVLTTGVQPCSLRLNPSRCVVGPYLQLIQSCGALTVTVRLWLGNLRLSGHGILELG